MYVVTIEPLRGIYFLDTITASLRERASKDSRIRIQEGVELDLPVNYDTWSEGAESPEQIVCTSVTNPKHYKMFKYLRDVDPTEFKPTGKHFAGIYSSTSWERFMKNLPARLALEEVPDTEPPGATDEAIAALKRRG